MPTGQHSLHGQDIPACTAPHVKMIFRQDTLSHHQSKWSSRYLFVAAKQAEHLIGPGRCLLQVHDDGWSGLPFLMLVVIVRLAGPPAHM